ncbi:MAG: hypothetical protein ABW086_15995 [Sedimenticola sp.]
MTPEGFLNPVDESLEEQKKKDKVEREWEIAETISQGWLEAYQAGEITFGKLVNKLPLAVEKLSDRKRWLLLGEVIDKALKASPPQLGKKKPKTPSWIRDVAVELVDMAVEKDGYKLSVSSNRSAFVFVADLLVDHGVVDKLSPDTVENWYYSY